jgi:hypothetical protein
MKSNKYTKYILNLFFSNFENPKLKLMENTNQKKPVWLGIIRWTARIISLLLVGFFLLMFIGESIGEHAKATDLTFIDIVGLSIWFLNLLGMLIAFKWEGFGGGLSLFFVLVHIVIIAINHTIPFPLFFFAIPGILYLTSWYFHKKLGVK